jgi:hypothetical protein
MIPLINVYHDTFILPEHAGTTEQESAGLHIANTDPSAK